MRSRIFFIALGTLVLSVGVVRSTTIRRRNDTSIPGSQAISSRLYRQITKTMICSHGNIVPGACQAISFDKDSPIIVRTKKEADPCYFAAFNCRETIPFHNGDKGSTSLESNCIHDVSFSGSVVLLI